MPGEERGVCTRGSQDRTEEGERACGRSGDSTACRAAGSGGGQGPQIVRGLAADQADGHAQHAEGKQDAGGG